MKMKKTLVVTAVFTMILGFLAVVPVHALVTFNDWEGLWFKGTVQDRGFDVDDSGSVPRRDNVRTYGYVHCWDVGNMVFDSYLVQQDKATGQWGDAMLYTVQVINDGNPLDYVGYGFIPPGTVSEIEVFALILRVKAREKDGEIKNANAKTLGGCVIYDKGIDGQYFAAGESLKLRLTDETRVPDDVKQKIEVLLLPECPAD